MRVIEAIIPRLGPMMLIALIAVGVRARGAQVSQVSKEHAIRAVVFLQVPSRNPGDKGLDVGSGFFVAIEGKLFLVTAAHVASLMSRSASITLGVENDDARTIGISDLTGAPGDPKWISHSVADVAALLLRPTNAIETLLIGRALPPSIFRSKLEAPPRDRPLTIVGFPLGLGVVHTGPEGKISAIEEESKPTSGLVTLPRFDTKQRTEFFVLDKPSVGGFSGAPVFMLPAAFSQGSRLVFSSAIRFVGLIHGTVSDDTGGKFALVVPSAFVTQTLERAYAAASK